MSSPSFEFFPPRQSTRLPDLAAVARDFAAAGAHAFSVTYGAGGSTRQGTLQTVQTVMEATGLATVPHLACLGETNASLGEFLDQALDLGCSRIMVIRGDQPEGGLTDGPMNHALELVQFIREQAGDKLAIEVACYPETHPEATDPEADLRYLHLKQQAGAEVAVSQLFFEAEVFLRFDERCRDAGIDMELVPGIMPATSLSGIERMSKRCGSAIPSWFGEALAPFEDGSEQQQQKGIELLAEQCQILLDAGVPRIHFYSLNRLQPSLELCRRLNWPGEPVA